ncbi:MAG TPA: glycosyltransferase family 2 protein [Acidimicrobiia bacterium]|nr:glycosyltransferase family 2 protein [Acidimicrobiia bacterium]
MTDPDATRTGGVTRYPDAAVVMISRDEEQAIGRVIDDVRRAVPEADVVVVDGSSDRTPEIAVAHGARVIREPGDGPASALVAALQASDRPVVATVDADNTYPAELLPAVIELVRCGFDVVGTDRLGFRRPATMPAANYLANRAFNLIASIRARRRVRDVHSGMRAYRRTVIEEFRWDTQGMALPVDLLLWPVAAGLRVVEIPIEYRDRIGSTTLVRFPGTVWTLRRLLRPFPGDGRRRSEK